MASQGVQKEYRLGAPRGAPLGAPLRQGVIQCIYTARLGRATATACLIMNREMLRRRHTELTACVSAAAAAAAAAGEAGAGAAVDCVVVVVAAGAST